MPMLQINNVTLTNITKIMNVTSGDPAEVWININHYVFGGWFFFILLCLMGIILFRKAQQKQDQPLINIMYISTALTLISFFARAMFIFIDGIQVALLTDFQMWLFPLIAVISALTIRFSSS